MRVGPSRLISTAWSSGESKETVAAEWMTTFDSGEDGAGSLVESESVGGDVTGDRGDPTRAHLREALFAEVLAEPVESVVGEQFTLGPAGGGGSTPITNKQNEFAVGNASQEPFHEGRADEARGASDGDPLPGETFGDHDPMSSRFSTKW